MQAHVTTQVHQIRRSANAIIDDSATAFQNLSVSAVGPRRIARLPLPLRLHRIRANLDAALDAINAEGDARDAKKVFIRKFHEGKLAEWYIPSPPVLLPFPAFTDLDTDYAMIDRKPNDAYLSLGQVQREMSAEWGFTGLDAARAAQLACQVFDQICGNMDNMSMSDQRKKARKAGAKKDDTFRFPFNAAPGNPSVHGKRAGLFLAQPGKRRKMESAEYLVVEEDFSPAPWHFSQALQAILSSQSRSNFVSRDGQPVFFKAETIPVPDAVLMRNFPA
jgi:hypothetical protein